MHMQKIFESFSRLMPVWVVVLGVAGFFYPGAFLFLRPYLDLMFFFTMIGIGAVLNFSDFKPIFNKPQTVALGLFAQFLIMPALGFAIGKALNLSPSLRLGLVLAGCVPGAMASNVIAYLAKTDVAYSIAITSSATLLSPLLTPALIYFYARTFIDIPFIGMFLTIIKIVILPLITGLILRHFFEKQIRRIQYVFPAFSTLFIAFICAMVVALNRDYFLELTAVIFLAVFIHNFSGLAMGYGAGILFRFSKKRKRTLAIEIGMQNAGLGALLALKHFSSQTALVPAVFATWCVITASILAEIWSQDNLCN
jgi:BASS family bile acid:Na+ symporter